MKPRKLELGDRNIIGKRVTEARLAQGMKQVELLINHGRFPKWNPIVIVWEYAITYLPPFSTI